MELDWESTSANLDLYLWGAGSLAGLNAINENTLVYSYANYAQKPTDPVGSTFENVFVPANVAEVEPDTKAFGVSIVYRSGTVDPLAFTLHHVDYINGAWEPLAGVEEYDGTYALDNINSFPTVLTFPAVVQTFEIVGGEIANVTALDLPDTGSRVSSSTANAKPRIITHNTGKKKLYLPVASSTVTSAKTLKRTPRLSELRRR